MCGELRGRALSVWSVLRAWARQELLTREKLIVVGRGRLGLGLFQRRSRVSSRRQHLVGGWRDAAGRLSSGRVGRVLGLGRRGLEPAEAARALEELAEPSARPRCVRRRRGAGSFRSQRFVGRAGRVLALGRRSLGLGEASQTLEQLDESSGGACCNDGRGGGREGGREVAIWFVVNTRVHIDVDCPRRPAKVLILFEIKLNFM